MAAWSREVLAGATAVAAISVYVMLQRHGLTQLRALGARTATALVQLMRPSVMHTPLHALQREPPVAAWVALCGTVFDVTDDPFFDAHTGVYALWTGHDITHLLVQMGVALDGADDAAMASYRDQELPLARLDPRADESARRMALLTEWYTRFHTRYDVVAQIADLYTGSAWDAIREQLLPPAVRFGSNSGSGSSERVRGKCPMGFGSRALDHVLSRADPRSEALRTVTFQGKRYDVSHSSLFEAPHGEFAHFVGHDITFALATQSHRRADLDKQPQRAYTYAEQVLLERYRVAFARELALLADDDDSASTHTDARDTATARVDVHALLDACDGADSCGGDDTHRALAQHFAVPEHTCDVDRVCARTTMTPLHKAVEKNRLDLVELLVRAGADVSAEAALYDFETPLQMAQRFHHSAIAAFLATTTDTRSN